MSHFLIIFTFYSYYFHIVITFWGSGPRSGPQKLYFCYIPGHIFVHIIFMLFSHFGARDPGLSPKAAARGPGRARRRFGA